MDTCTDRTCTDRISETANVSSLGQSPLSGTLGQGVQNYERNRMLAPKQKQISVYEKQMKIVGNTANKRVYRDISYEIIFQTDKNPKDFCLSIGEKREFLKMICYENIDNGLVQSGERLFQRIKDDMEIQKVSEGPWKRLAGHSVASGRTEFKIYRQEVWEDTGKKAIVYYKVVGEVSGRKLLPKSPEHIYSIIYKRCSS